MTQLGVVMSSPLPSGMRLPNVANLAREAEALGFDCIWAEDLLYRGDRAVLDVTCVLSACAAATETIDIGSAIFAPSLRSLAWALKQVATVHLLAEGRLTLGVALGASSEDEYRLAGLARAGHRQRTDEFLSVLAAWRENTGRSAMPGATGALLLGGEGPAPPVWVGGTSPAALERAARFGDGWLSGSQTPAEFRTSLTRLQQLAQERGRPCPKAGVVLSVAVGPPSDDLAVVCAESMQTLYGTPGERAVELAIGGTPEQVAEQIGLYVDAGAEKIAVVSAVLPWSRSWPQLAEVRRLLLSRQ